MNNDALKKLLDKIPFNRLMVYLIALGFLPVVLAGFHYLHKKQQWDDVSSSIQSIQSVTEIMARKQYLNAIVRNTFTEVDQTYIENQLETLSLLKKERENLEQLLRSPTFTGNESARLYFSAKLLGKLSLIKTASIMLSLPACSIIALMWFETL